MKRIEIIGREITVTQSPNKTLEGIQGKAVLETKNTITIETKKGTKTLIKKTIKIKLDNGDNINGAELVGNAIERKGAK